MDKFTLRITENPYVYNRGGHVLKAKNLDEAHAEAKKYVKDFARLSWAIYKNEDKNPSFWHKYEGKEVYLKQLWERIGDEAEALDRVLCIYSSVY